jgi:hypothetical protein
MQQQGVLMMFGMQAGVGSAVSVCNLLQLLKFEPQGFLTSRLQQGCV